MSDEASSSGAKHPFLMAIGITLVLMFIVGSGANWAYDAMAEPMSVRFAKQFDAYGEFLDFQKEFEEQKQLLEIQGKWDKIKEMQKEYDERREEFQSLMAWFAKVGIDPTEALRKSLDSQ